MKNPLVSIGVPAYNNEKYILETLQSLLHQSYKNIEIIISDDCSTDDTFAISKKAVSTDKRVRLYKQNRNLGTADNFNFVLKKAKGKYFMWTAGDDIRDPDCVKLLVKLLISNPSVTIAVSAMRQFNNSKNLYKHASLFQYTDSFSAAKIYLQNSEFVSLMVLGMYRTGILKKFGGYHKDYRPMFEGASDFITSYKIILQGDLGYIDKALLHKRDTGYYLNIFDLLKSKNKPGDLLFRLKRYMKFPLMFLFDFSYSVYYTLISPLPSNQKIIIFFYCVGRYIIEHLRFLRDITRGTYSYIYGITFHTLKTYSRNA